MTNTSNRYDGNDNDSHKASDDNNNNNKLDQEEEEFEDAPINQGFLSRKRKTVHHHYTHGGRMINPNEWMRPYWLGSGLFLILFAFWLLDSIKDPIFVKLVDGKISEHQPHAKLCSVLTTLILVCILEFWTNLRQKWKHEALIEKDNEITPSEEVLDPGGIWKRIQMKSAFLASSTSFMSPIIQQHDHNRNREIEIETKNAIDDIASIDVFYYIGIPYLVMFSIISYFVWRFEQRQKTITSISILLSPIFSSSNNYYNTASKHQQQIIDIEHHEDNHNTEENQLGDYILGYILYATVESFGSLAVATFWSYTNSTLSLVDAERYYGPIIATAQLGAIGGSTLVATGRWESSYLLIVVALSIVLQLLIMHGYDRRFVPTNVLVVEQQQHILSLQSSASTPFTSNSNTKGYYGHHDNDTRSVLTWQDNNATITKPFWSGLYLIFQHSYVLLILGVSCLYEISMTLLDYQMKLLGFAKFNDNIVGTATGVSVSASVASMMNTTMTTVLSSSDDNSYNNMSFTEFMGHYGQVVNITSLIFSSLLFPFLIRRFGLRKTLLGFPTMLLVVTFLAYIALPGNLTVLLVSLSLLKAMTYSVHDPSKEMLYIPTSNAIKLRAKFWIDVVGERITKAVGSAFNTFAKDVEQSVKIGYVPSLLSALSLWLVCYYVGLRFDKLLATGKIVGLEHSIDPSTYKRISREDEENNDADQRNYEVDYHDEPSEVEICFDEDNVSTLDLMADPVRDVLEGTAGYNNYNNNFTTSSSSIELPALFRMR
mmetsp:Transcript_670/g.724  ORF Transcript_670/g.724 Transcript_670/m.724 type:complete len:770 (+) Transcript_670:159-2468(+)